MTPTEWPADPAILRAEIEVMLEALLEATDARIPPEHLRGVYFKGSASKVWQAPCDYVPELSDLDLHLWLRDDVAPQYEAQFRDSLFGLAYAADAEKRFLARVPQPLHWPRPQVLILNEAMRYSGVWHRSHVTVLRGEAYPGADPQADEDREILLKVSTEANSLGLSFMDKLGPQLWSVLRSLNFRISPLPARLLSSVGSGAWVWQEPRSRLIVELSERGFDAVAQALGEYYAYAWSAFESRWQNPAPMRGAIDAGLRALALATEISKR